MPFISTYCLRLVEEFLNNNAIDYQYSSPHMTSMLHESGVLFNIAGDFHLNVQTHPIICGDAFAKTALLFQGQNVSIPALGYLVRKQHFAPEELFHHIAELRQELTDYSITSIEEASNGNKNFHIKTFGPGGERTFSVERKSEIG